MFRLDVWYLILLHCDMCTMVLVGGGWDGADSLPIMLVVAKEKERQFGPSGF